jgi:hypothetical protein
MQIAVTDTAIEDLDSDILGPWCPPVDSVGRERRGGGLDGIGFGLHENSGDWGGDMDDIGRLATYIKPFAYAPGVRRLKRSTGPFHLLRKSLLSGRNMRRERPCGFSSGFCRGG